MKIAFYLWLTFVSLFAGEANFPNELNSWKSLSYVGAAKSVNELSNATLTVGKASYVGLINTPKMQYVLRPVNEGGTVSYGGIFKVEIKDSGVYRIVLGNASWIDLVKDGKAVLSVKHQGGPEGSGIRKIVDYPLEAGVYTLQLSAGGDSVTAILVTKIK